jgi:putative nucleotidyltransferase with HDIG domain
MIISNDQSNRLYFWSKFVVTLFILFLWIYNTDFFSGASNTSLAAGLLISILTTLGYGIVFKNHSYQSVVTGTFSAIDIVSFFTLILPSYPNQLISIVLALLLLISTMMFLFAQMRIIVAGVYFLCLLCVFSYYYMSGSETILAELLVISTLFVFMLYLNVRAHYAMEYRLKQLEQEKNSLAQNHAYLSKEVKYTNQRLELLNKDLRKKSFEIQNILNLTGQLGENPDSKHIISSFLLTMVGQLGSGHAVYLGAGPAGKNYYAVVDQKGIHDKRIENLRIYKDSFLIQILKATREPLLIKNIPKEQLYKDEQELLSYFSNDLLSSIQVRNKIIGLFIIGSKISGAVFSKDDLNLIGILTNQAAFILEQANINNEIYDFYYKTVRVLLRSLEAKYSYAKGHAIRTAQYVTGVAKKLNFSSEELKYLTYGTLLHDVGKIAIKDDILHYDKVISNINAPIKDKILEHTVVGASILRSVGFDDQFVDLALHHHEYYNGQGYPHGLKGEKISLPARILSVCNAYDAMISDKPYRKSMQTDWAQDQLRNKAGSQFDPDIVPLFLTELDTNPAFSKMQIRH